jgi:hypothetical protein
VRDRLIEMWVVRNRPRRHLRPAHQGFDGGDCGCCAMVQHASDVGCNPVQK